MSEFIYPLRVYIEDTDCTGVVYHANYLNYFERARSEWAEKIGMGLEWQQSQSIFFTVRYAKLDYLQPALAHQQIEVVTRIAVVRPASLVYEQYLRLAETIDTILCKAEIKIACVNRQMRPCGLPKSLIQLLGERA
jgi:acyl-CoA thioester hydrolase